MDRASLDLTQQAAPKVKALGTLTVTGWMRNTVITSAGHLGTITAGGMDGATVRAGVLAMMGPAMPSQSGDFPAQCVLEALAIKGMKQGGVSVPSFVNSSVAAWRIARAAVRSVATDNAANGGASFGLSADQFDALTWLQGPQLYRWPAHWAVDPGDFAVLDV